MNEKLNHWAIMKIWHDWMSNNELQKWLNYDQNQEWNCEKYPGIETVGMRFNQAKWSQM